MSYYEMTKEERTLLGERIFQSILADIIKGKVSTIDHFFSDDDTYVRKVAYQAVGKIYREMAILQTATIALLDQLWSEANPKVRQTTVNAAGEIGIREFKPVVHFFDKGLFDEHSTVRNAVIGSVKKMGEKNPVPALQWASGYLDHPDKEVRREICHGIELRGRTHPQDILPLLKKLQHDPTARVRNTLVHILGQIAYKKGCLATVVAHLITWENKELVEKALQEIVDVHHRYQHFAVLNPQQAIDYIASHYHP